VATVLLALTVAFGLILIPINWSPGERALACRIAVDVARDLGDVPLQRHLGGPFAQRSVRCDAEFAAAGLRLLPPDANPPYVDVAYAEIGRPQTFGADAGQVTLVRRPAGGPQLARAEILSLVRHHGSWRVVARRVGPLS
jgi:hypothetical protein